MNLIDKAIAYVAPETALRREQSRQALDQIRGYDAAKRNRRTEGWNRTSGSANAEITPGLATIRNGSRELVRNNPYARRAINVLVAKSIGTGIRARIPETAQTAWDEFEENCDHEGVFDFYGLQSLIARGGFESGEAIIRRIRLSEGRVPLRLQILEPDYLDTLKFGLQANGNYIIAGVEIDRAGRRQAYWLYDQHPGETAAIPRSLKSKRIPASEIILFGERERPGQLRCMPRLATTMLRFRDQDDWRDTVMLKKKIEACFVAFVHGGNPSKALGQAVVEDDGRKIETMAPGMIYRTEQGESVEFGNPSSSVDGGFNRDELHGLAVGCGVTYEQLTGDLSMVNFSSMRAGMNDFIDMVEMWRWIQFIPQVLTPVKGWFLEAAWTAGSIRTIRHKFIWTPPSWPYVNPIDDVKADKELIKGGIRSLSEVIRRRGDDPAEVFKELASDKTTLAELGVKVDTDISNAPARAPADPAAKNEDGTDVKPKSEDS